MNENICVREELQPFKDLFTFLINQNLQLTKELEKIKIQMNNQQQHFTQQTTNLQLEIDQLKQKLNQQNDHLTKLDNDQQESALQSKQHLQLIQHRLNYLGEFYRKTNGIFHSNLTFSFSFLFKFERDQISNGNQMHKLLLGEMEEETNQINSTILMGSMSIINKNVFILLIIGIIVLLNGN